MKKSLKFLLLTSALAITSFFPVQAQQIELDRVSAIVNGGVVLESEIRDLIETIKKQALKNDQSLPSDKALRTQVTEKLINDALITQLGERMGVQVSDAQLDETLTNMAKEDKLTLEQFRQNLVKDGTDYDKYREIVRTELISGEVRRNSVSRRIYVSPQDVANLISSMEEKINTDVEYRLGHILIEFPANPSQDDMNAAKVRAEKVIELLNNGSDFAKIAIASSGGTNALQGGDLGWKNINELPTLFSSIVDGEKKEAILGPVRTGLGFSIVKIIDIRGLQIVEVEEVKARHILIEPSVILSEAKAESILQGLMDRINAGEADFADLAKEYSDGPTSVRGGDLGWADPDVYDPTFKAALSRLKINEMHKPFRTSFGWHLAQLTDRRTLDATEQMNESKARRILFNRKFGLESARWIKELRDEAYVEIFSRDTK
ncbi:peptidylprolyl isomerase SurA [Colwellia hornerae]|uniref:Chaperone SurA n=1 Tax=Colwellia hornerae TaxID=89402 RepID=A0A5C6QC35_9GAMM|nr:peptidylprolyl isomerase SurA [Colwellia hornerae]TWX53023.1 peptidylprolyl isomerase SurA [Colwellia hornerae]TWX59286.1 peptidylprolyl isomerase SurA [Colwellia hornerae]TWX66172.1 peptidylprolyl isomerase SurA [Colwellia hornerae]